MGAVEAADAEVDDPHLPLLERLPGRGDLAAGVDVLECGGVQ
jgi:hypothetical protein